MCCTLSSGSSYSSYSSYTQPSDSSSFSSPTSDDESDDIGIDDLEQKWCATGSVTNSISQQHIAGLAFDPLSTTNVAFASGKNVRLLNLQTGEERALAGPFESPQGISFSPDGLTIAVADIDKPALLLLSVTSGTISRVVPLEAPADVSFVLHGTKVAVADGNLIRLISLQGNAGGSVVEDLAGTKEAAFANGFGPKACFNGPKGVATAPDSVTIAVADTGNHRIRLVHAVSGEVRTIAGTGSPGMYW
jgi:DNA-binding beta-propeller fold protein YncE